MNDRHLAIKALERALTRRCPEAGLLHHSDQGCTYASEDYQRILDACGITCNMSRRGDCYDNAVMEGFFSTVKSELADRFDSFAEAKMEFFDYIEATTSAGIDSSARLVPPPSNDAHATERPSTFFDHRRRPNSTNPKADRPN